MRFPAVAIAAYPQRFRVDHRQWLAAQLLACRTLRGAVAAHWRGLADREGLVVANNALRVIVKRLTVADFNAACDDRELVDFADVRARMCARYGNRVACAQGYAERSAAVYGLAVPREGAAARVCDAKWWARQLRRLAARRCEAVLRDMGLTRRGGGVYVSDHTYRAWLHRQRRNRDLLERTVAENDRGQSYTLADLSDLGTSNPVIRRGELMTRMRGFEEWMSREARDWVPMFYTVTCPSRFHAQLSAGGGNSKYDKSTPEQGQRYLVRLWSQIRAECARQGIAFFGFRVAEPHHDGTPHWHLLLIVEVGSEPALTGVLRDYAMRADREADGLHREKAARARFDAVRIESARGSATGYISKYISKNIDGFAVGDDWEAGDFADNTAARVRAWASTWGIRQFQQIGGPPVTVWRELRRAANHPERLPGVVGEDDQLALVLAPADAGDWCEFTEKMGGAVCPRADRPVQIFYVTRDRAGQSKIGKYGDVVKVVRGLIVRGLEFPLVTRIFEWVVRVAGGSGGAFARRGAPWTCVNNCTWGDDYDGFRW